MKIIDLQNFIEGETEKLNKKLGVELVEMGFLNYTKLTSINYNFWWYEVENIKLIDPKKFTYEWADLKKTRKFRVLEILIDFHDEKENIYNLLNNALNIISALDDGINVNTEIPCFIEVFNMYYEGRKLKEKQLKLF